jgi:hypothetical protein
VERGRADRDIALHVSVSEVRSGWIAAGMREYRTERSHRGPPAIVGALRFACAPHPHELIAARPDTRAWHEYILDKLAVTVRFLRGRARFVGRRIRLHCRVPSS